MKKRNVIIINFFILLIFSCTITRMVILNNELSISQNKEFSVSNIIIEAPIKEQKVFTFEDIHTFSLPGISTRFAASEEVDVVTHTPGEVITINRANFEYYLSENSDSIFYDALSTMFSIEHKSPYTVQCKADLKYYLPKRGYLSNVVGIYMHLDMMIIRDSVKVFENNYEAAEEETYSTAWVTIPSNSVMNGLFNRALSQIMDQIISDNRIEVVLKNKEHKELGE